jgi:hypothetical protein
MKKVWFSLPPIIITMYLGIIIGSLYFVNQDKLVGDLRASLVQIFVEKDEDIEVSSPRLSFSPLPVIKLDSVKSPTKFNAISIKLHFSYLSLLSLSPYVNSITIGGISVKETLFDNNDMHNLLPELDNLSKASSGLESFDIANLYVLDFSPNDSEGISYSHFNKIKVTKSLGSISFASSYVGKNLDVSGRFNFPGDDQMNLEIDIKGENYSGIVKAEGDIRDYKGQIRLDVAHLSDFLNSNFNDLDLLLTKITSDESALLKGNLEVKQEGYSIPEIKLDSPSVKATGSYIPGDKDNNNEFNLQIKSFDLDKLTTKKSRGDYRTPQNRYKIYFSESLDTSFKIDINKFIAGGNEIKDITSNGRFRKGELILDNLVAKEEEGSKLELGGKLTQNDYRSVFNGDVNLKTPKFNRLLARFYDSSFKTEDEFTCNYSSKIRMTPREFNLREIKARLGLLSIGGNLAVKLIGTTPRIQGDLGLSNLELEEKSYPLITPFYDYIKSLGNFGSKNYIKKYQPIRNFPYLASINLDIDNIKLNQEQLDYISGVVNLEPAKANLNNINLTYRDKNIGGFFKVTVGELKPYFDTSVKFDELDLSPYSFEDILSFRDRALDKVDLDKFNLKLQSKINKLYWSNEKQNKVEFNRLAFAGEVAENNYKINSLNAKLYDAGLEASGKIGFKPLNFNLIYSLSGMDLDKFAANILPGQFYTRGRANVSGSVLSRGETLSEIKDNLKSENSIIAKNVSLANFNLDDLIISYKDSEITPYSESKKTDKILASDELFIKQLDSKFEIDGAKLSTSNLTFSTKQSTAEGEFTSDLADYTIDGKVKFKFKDSRSARNNKITFPVEVSGSLFDPSIKYNLGEFKPEGIRAR